MAISTCSITSHAGALMGWMGTAGSMGRIVLPGISGFVSTLSIFSISAALAAVAVALLWQYTRMVQSFNRRQLIAMDGILAA